MEADLQELPSSTSYSANLYTCVKMLTKQKQAHYIKWGASDYFRDVTGVDFIHCAVDLCNML